MIEECGGQKATGNSVLCLARVGGDFNNPGRKLGLAYLTEQKLNTDLIKRPFPLDQSSLCPSLGVHIVVYIYNG